MNSAARPDIKKVKDAKLAARPSKSDTKRQKCPERSLKAAPNSKEEVKTMGKKHLQKERTESSPKWGKRPHVKRSVEWNLTEEDKLFLRSCNISPE